ncbi:MAG: hypothetical protein D3903_21420 [Candidatus Electrothrix sp. GM3_4]|nr:hypothetical protein [Candidatus Electrothrix sp. GM3_4]
MVQYANNSLNEAITITKALASVGASEQILVNALGAIYKKLSKLHPKSENELIARSHAIAITIEYASSQTPEINTIDLIVGILESTYKEILRIRKLRETEENKHPK